MSLEAAIQANTAALEGLIAALSNNTDVLQKVDAGREAAMSVIQANTGAKAATPKATKAEKPVAAVVEAVVEPVVEPVVEAPKADDYAGEQGFNRLKVAVVTPYLNTDDKDEQKARMAVFAKALMTLGAVGDDGKPGLGKLATDKRATLASWIETLARGENVPELADDESAGNGLLD